PAGEVRLERQALQEEAAEATETGSELLAVAVALEVDGVEDERPNVPGGDAELVLERSQLGRALGEAAARPGDRVEEPVERHAAHRRVARVVRVVAVVRAVERARRRVRHVRVPVMDPREEGPAARAPDPAEEAPVRLLGAEGDVDPVRRLVNVKMAERRAEGALGSHVLGADERRRPVAGTGED